MNFFESQDVARRKTGRLVVMFIGAVIAIIVLAHLVVAGSIVGFMMRREDSVEVPWTMLLDWRLFAPVAIGVVFVVGAASLFKLTQLSRGGAVVAERLDGRRLNTGGHDVVEQRVLNVVEEMAIASGTAVFPVYLMEKEDGINAFAAGHTPADAVIGITRGCAERLSRDELQGVVAHEFSHILNGDMRLNLRLVGVLHGILVIGLLGQVILRTWFYAGGVHRRSNRSGGHGALAILAIGGGLIVVGFAGVFFGNWIKAAVSRQREFLADASAVQFTRNPDGIAGALKKIGGVSRRAAVVNPHASEASHMFFGRAVTSGLNSIFSTHPPLPERIRRLDPDWDGAFVASTREGRESAADRASPESDRRSRLIAQLSAAAPAVALAAGTAVERIGRPTPAHLDYARGLLSSMPKEVAAAAREPHGARAIVIALLVDRHDQPRERQLARLERNADADLRAEVRRLRPSTDGLDARLRLPLLDLALPALRDLTDDQYAAFRAIVEDLIRADDRLDLFEWCLQRIVIHHLDAVRERRRAPHAAYYSLGRLGRECSVLLSTLVRVGHEEPGAADRAFAAATTHLGAPGLRLLPKAECGLTAMDQALDRLARVTPRLKEQLVTACAAAVSADHEITVNEAELLRAICELLGCPMPPLLPGQPVV